MSERSSRKKKKDYDFSVTAFRIVQEATKDEKASQAEPEQPEMTPEERHAAAVALGRLGGKKGGKARAEKLTTEQRQSIARHAAEMRWAVKKQ